MSLISFLFLLSIPNSSLAQVSPGACQAIVTDGVAECTKIYDLKRKECKITEVTTGGVAADAKVLSELERCKAELQVVKTQCEARAKAASDKCTNDQKVAEAEKAKQEAQKQNALANESTATVDWERARARLETNPIPGTILIDPTAKAEMDRAEIQIAQAREIQAQTETRIGELDNVIADINDFKGQMDAVKKDALAEANVGRVVTTKASDDIKKRVTEIGGKPDSTPSDRGDGTQRTGTGGNKEGQGGGPGGNQAGKKNDEGEGQGGGDSGLGGMPSPQSRAEQPAQVAQPAQDCSNPQVASSNPVCACRQNPSDSRCQSILAENAGPAKKSSAESGGSYGGSGGGLSGSSPEAKQAQAKNISKHGQLEQGAGGSVGKGVGTGQGSGAAAGSKAANGQRANLRDQTSSRGSGGRGGGGGGMSGGSLTAGGNRYATSLGTNDPRNRRAPVASRKKLTPQELRQQLQAQFNANMGKRRLPSGVVGPDGITGPHTDQFKKIRSRYADAFGQ